MRTLTAPALAALQAGCPLVLLVEMDLSTPLNLNTSSLTLTYGGVTYLGVGMLGKIGAIGETAAEVKQLVFELSGVPSSSVALALAEPVQGKAVRIKLAVLDPTTYLILDVRLRWAGVLDVFQINDSPQGATLQVTAEHAGIDLTRPYSSLYSDLEQQRLNPGDLAFQFNADQVDSRIVWPDANYGKVS